MIKKVFLIIYVLLAVSSELHATTGAVVTPSSIMHTVSTNAPIVVNWNVAGPVGFHTSSVGTFINPSTGRQIGTSSINTTLVIQCVVVSTSTICNPQTEIIRIPADVLNAAVAGKLTRIDYSRLFTDGTPSRATLQINLILPNPGSVLRISRISLRFSDNKIIKITKPKSKIVALAEIKYTGTGIINAVWEYAGPESTAGKPIYTQLRLVQHYLGAGGRVILQSPRLPTLAKGQYLLRLNIRKTQSNPTGVAFSNNLPDDLPLLRYIISDKQDDIANPSLPSIKTLSPLNHALLKSDTQFSWEAVKGAKAYQLELFLAEDSKKVISNDIERRIDDAVVMGQEPSSGLLIPASKTSLSLSALARNSLQHGQFYYWRIVAIGIDGQILTRSELRLIRLP